MAAKSVDTVIVRDATVDDMGAVNDLYNALIGTTTVAWTDTPEPFADRLAWFDRLRHGQRPVLVAEEHGAVVGYTAYESFRGAGKWPGYRYTVEHTIHVARDHWGHGVGRRLMTELIDRARIAGMHAMVGAVDADNAASIGFHERLGFQQVARMPEVGRKFDRWLDLVFVQLIIEP